MPIVSAGDLTSLRSEYQRAAVRLSWLVPPVLWSARIDNGSIVKGDTTIAFDAGTGSYFGMVEALQEVWVGTAAGDNDVGRLRLKSISSGDAGVTGSITVGGHSHPLQDDLYLTFLHDYPLKPKYSYIDPATETWYMDDTVTYSDQHTKPPPVVVAGPHRAGFLISGTATFNVDASESYTIASGATKSSYALSVASTAGAPTVNFNTGTGLGDVTFTAAGVYWAKYSVTDSNGKTQISYRCYILHVSDDPTSADAPWTDCEGVQLEADWESGGWTAGVKAHNNMALADIPDHTLCIIWHSPWYEGAIKHVTFLPDDNPAVFVGYVREDSGTQQMAEGFGEAELVLSTVEGRLRRMFTFSTSLIVKKTTPTEWWEYEKWQTCGTIVHDLFLWRSTLLETTDVIGLRDDTLNRMFQGFDEGNIYDNANNFLYSEGIRKKVLSDQGGRLHVVEDQQLMVDADRGALTTSFPLIQTAAIADYGAAFAIQRKQEFDAPFVTANGFYWDGNTWDDEDRPSSETSEYCSIAPGGKPLWEGPDPQDFPKQTVSSQDHLNQICGRYEAKVNNPIVEVVVEFHGMYSTVLDIAYGEQHTISLQATETPRGIVWSNKPLYCRHIQAVYESGTGTWAVNAAFEPENITTDGVYTECSSFPPLGGEVPPISTIGQPGALLTGASVNFKGASGGLWVERVAQDVKDIIEDPFWRAETDSNSPDDAIVFRCGVGFIRRSTDGFEAVDVDVTPGTDPPNDAGDSPAPTATGVTYFMMEGSYLTQNEFAVIARWQNGSGDWRSWIAFTDDSGTTYSWKTLGEVIVGCAEKGTKSSAFSTGYWDGSHAGPRTHRGNPILNVGTDTYVITYRDASENNVYVRAFTMSGDDITWGSAVDVDACPSTGGENGLMILISSGKFAIVYQAPGGIGELCRPAIKLGTVAGTAISLGSQQDVINDYESAVLMGANFEPGTGIAITSPSSGVIVVFKFGKIMEDGGGDYCAKSSDYGHWVMWGNISGLGISWEEWESPTGCGAIQQETVGKWRDVERSLTITNLSQAIGIPFSGFALFAYHMNDGANKVIKLFTVTASEDTVDGLTTAVSGLSVEWTIFKLTSTKAVLAWQTWSGSDYSLKAAVITGGAATPTVGTANTLRTSAGATDWIDDLYGAALTTDYAVLSYTINGGDCQSNMLLDISGDTITVDEVCDEMNEYAAGVGGQTITKYMLMGWDSATANGVMWTGITANDVQACAAGDIDSYAMGISLAKLSGGVAWVTTCNDATIELLRVNLSTMTIADRVALGAGTIAQAIAKTYVAYPFVPFAYDDAVYVYGRMDNPRSLGSPAHIIRTTDGGTSFGLIEGGWEDDHCGSLVVHLTNQMFAIRNAEDRSKLYADDADNILVLKMTLPFFAQVAPHGMLLDYYTLDVYACAWSADVWMVAKVAPPYLAASNLTFNHDATEGIESIVVL